MSNYSSIMRKREIPITHRYQCYTRMLVILTMIVVTTRRAFNPQRRTLTGGDKDADQIRDNGPETQNVRPGGSFSSKLAGLPQRPIHAATKPTDKILVVYSGPTELVDRAIAEQPDRDPDIPKQELYRLNFEHFLKYGVQCKTQDTVLIVTDAVRQHYRSQIHKLNENCQTRGHQVIMAVRNNTCRDLESVRRVIHDNIVDIDSYDYFVFANCGTTGPSRKWADLPWTDIFIEKLTDRVKMSGLTLNCGTGTPHIQSMVYALDPKGLQIIKNSNVVFDCKKEPKNNPREDQYVSD
jgi:hypothetical protein